MVREGKKYFKGITLVDTTVHQSIPDIPLSVQAVDKILVGFGHKKNVTDTAKYAHVSRNSVVKYLELNGIEYRHSKK